MNDTMIDRSVTSSCSTMGCVQRRRGVRQLNDQLPARLTTAATWFLFSLTSLLNIAVAEEAAPFYRDKQISVVIGYPPGGGYDVYARLLARHLGRHVPGAPRLVTNNMPGAGSMIAANFLYNRAPKDGTVFGMFAGGMALSPLLGDPNARFDSRDLAWLGSMNEETSVCISWVGSGINSTKDLLEKEFTIGTSSTTGTSFTFPTAANRLVGTKFKLVQGYPGSSGVMLAVERGEVQGMCGIQLSTLQTVKAEWIEKKQINFVLQQTTARHAELPNVSTILDLAKSADTKQIIELVYGWQIMGRPFAAPAGVDKDKVAILRTAFDDTMKDPQFLTEAANLHVELSPISGLQIDSFINRAYGMPKRLVDQAIQAQSRSSSD